MDEEFAVQRYCVISGSSVGRSSENHNIIHILEHDMDIEGLDDFSLLRDRGFREFIEHASDESNSVINLLLLR